MVQVELNNMYINFFSVALRPNAGHGLLILEDAREICACGTYFPNNLRRSHTTTHHAR
jgi:hypothetical protein